MGCGKVEIVNVDDIFKFFCEEERELGQSSSMWDQRRVLFLCLFFKMRDSIFVYS